jgi:hypothetical protein
MYVHTKKNMPGCLGWIKQLWFLLLHCLAFIQGFELLFGCLLWFELSNCSNFWTLCFFGYLTSKSWNIYFLF